MITKARTTANSPHSLDQREKAGIEAEEQMAYHLDRAFGDAPDIALLHDLRFERKIGEQIFATQIDHLVIHRYGFCLIESKSVSTQIRVNAHGEFSRLWNGQYQGMASPIAQVKDQCEQMRMLLKEHDEQLLDKLAVIGVQGRFNDYLRWDALVAVSKNGLIERDNIAPPELLKAEEVPGRIKQWLTELRKADSFFNAKAPRSFNENEWKRIIDFLHSRHAPRHSLASPSIVKTPLPVTPPAKPAPPQAATAPQLLTCAIRPQKGQACGKCPAPMTQLEIQWGKYGYYFKCRTCDGNTPIDFSCPSCHREAKLRKDGPRFYWNCDPAKGGCGFDKLGLG